MQKILLLEDDKALNRGITLTLQNAGYNVISALTFSEAWEKYIEGEFSLVITDITLPDGNGLDFGKKVRERGDTYLIYLTALDSETDIVNGYACGADDYIVKPFSLAVLVSKVNALMRRIENSGETSNVYVCGDVEVNFREMKVYKEGREVALSKKEIQLLIYLWENAERIVSKESILEHVWDVDGQFVDDNTVAVNISRLKNKLGASEISNVRGLGYIWTRHILRK